MISAVMRTVRILAWTVAARKCVKPGMILDLPEPEAQLLVGIKKAEFVETATQEEADEAIKNGEAEIPADAVVPAPVEDGDVPVLDDAEPAPAPVEEVKEKKPKKKGKK